MSRIVKTLMLIIIIIICLCTNVKADSDEYYADDNIICNDGSRSRTCKDCHQGCCSGHLGCKKHEQETKSDDDFIKFVTYGIGASGIAGAAYAGSKYLAGKKR